MKELLLDLSHTSHTSANSGIQRVVRSLYESLQTLSNEHEFLVKGITWDPFAKTWRNLYPSEIKNVIPDPGRRSSRKRRASWPAVIKIRGHTARWGLSQIPRLESTDNMGIIFPEIISPNVVDQITRLPVNSCYPKVAIFHDAIPIKFPQLAPKKTVEYFPRYLEFLKTMD